jgi:hypothetical protein
MPLLPNDELIEYICNENNKDVIHILGKDGRDAPGSFRILWGRPVACGQAGARRFQGRSEREGKPLKI